MKFKRIILLFVASIGLHGVLYAQDTKKEEKITGTFFISLASDMRKLDNFFPDFGFSIEPIQKMKPIHWYAQISLIKGSYTTFQPDSTLGWGFTGGASIHPLGHFFIGIGGGTYLLSEEGKKKFFWGLNPHIGFETRRHKFTLGTIILQKRTDGVDIISFTIGRKFVDDDEQP
jgi:hypothetical protein